MDVKDSVFGINSVMRSEANSNQEVMITEKANGGGGGTPESQILPSAVEKAVNGSTLSGKLSGLDITERDGIGCSKCSGQPVDISLKKSTRSAKKFVPPAEENNTVELGIADMPDKGIGHVPSYSFNFKCAERVHKRKEFYLKIKEKNHAKEMERVIMLAKLKEAEEAEIKMLRKSLVIKAKPMPSFYFERSPIQMELKKVPARKAKSPQEGLPDSTNHSVTPTRFMGSSPPQCKRPLERSLPRFPPGRTNQSMHQEIPSLVKPLPCLGTEHVAGKTTG